jgi:putative ABC transport system permease protein
MIDAFDVNLTALSLLALIFGMFLIYNSVTFSVVQRRDLLGRLRTIGVTRAEIVRLILGRRRGSASRAPAIGAASGSCSPAGSCASSPARSTTSTSRSPWRASRSTRGSSRRPRRSAWAPPCSRRFHPRSRPAGAQPRLATLRSISEEGRAAWCRAPPRLGLVLLLAGGGSSSSRRGASRSASRRSRSSWRGSRSSRRPARCSSCAPRPALRLLGGTVGLMASRGVVSSLSRTAPAIAALVVAVSVTVGLGVMIQSFRGSLERWLDGRSAPTSTSRSRARRRRARRARSGPASSSRSPRTPTSPRTARTAASTCSRSAAVTASSRSSSPLGGGRVRLPQRRRGRDHARVPARRRRDRLRAVRVPARARRG